MDKRTALRPGTSVFNRQPTRSITDIRDNIRDGMNVPESAITVTSDGTIMFGGYKIEPTGLTLPDDISQDEWRNIGKVITNGLESSISWAIGDWAEKANKLWNWSYEAIAQEIGYPVETLMTYASVCRKYDTSIRNRGATFGHHRAVINQANRLEILERAVAEKWTVSQLQEMYPPPKQKSKKRKSPPPSRVDTWGGKEFGKNAQKLGQLLNAIGEGNTLTQKRRSAIWDYIGKLEIWLDAAKRSVAEIEDNQQ